MKDDTILTNGEFIIDHETEDWLDQLCKTIKDTVGDHPTMLMYPYRKDRCNYLAVDFDERLTEGSGQTRKGFSLTIAVAPYGKTRLDYPGIGCKDLVPTIRDSFDAITIAAHLGLRLRAEVAFNLPLPIVAP